MYECIAAFQENLATKLIAVSPHYVLIHYMDKLTVTLFNIPFWNVISSIAAEPHAVKQEPTNTLAIADTGMTVQLRYAGKDRDDGMRDKVQ